MRNFTKIIVVFASAFFMLFAAETIQVSALEMAVPVSTERVDLARWNFPNQSVFFSLYSDDINSIVRASGGLQSNTAGLQFMVNGNPRLLNFASGGASVNNLSGLAHNAWWQTTISTIGFTDIELRWQQRALNTGPRDWAIEFSIDGTNWLPADTNIELPSGNPVLGNTNIIIRNLPASANNQTTLYVRWLMISNTSTNGGNVTNTVATTQINNIVITGTSMQPEPVTATPASGYEFAYDTATTVTLTSPTANTTIFYRINPIDANSPWQEAATNPATVALSTADFAPSAIIETRARLLPEVYSAVSTFIFTQAAPPVETQINFTSPATLTLPEGQEYMLQLTAIATPDTPIIFSLSSDVPDGISINNDGELNIISTLAAGTHTFSITAAGNSVSVSQTFTLIITPTIQYPPDCCYDYPHCNCDYKPTTQYPPDCCDYYPDCKCDYTPTTQYPPDCCDYYPNCECNYTPTTPPTNPPIIIPQQPPVIPQPPILPPQELPQTTSQYIPWQPRASQQPTVSDEIEADVFELVYDEVDAGEAVEALEEAPALQRHVIRFSLDNFAYTIDGITSTNDVAPFLDATHGRTMVPLRAVSEALGAEVEWMRETRSVLIFTAAGTHILVVDVPLPDGMGTPVIIQDRVFVPLRFIAELLGAEVRWDGANRAAYVYY